MSEFDNEQISVLMDGELGNENTDITDRIIKNQELRGTWSRYHLIGDCLRGNLSDNISNDISSKISDALQSEPTVLAPKRTKRINLRPVAGFAIAASVAMVAVFGVQRGNEIDISTPGASVASNEVNTIAPQTFSFPETQVLPAAVKKTDTPDAIANQRLNNYLMNHNEYRSNGSINGILPYVRIVTIESQEK